MSYSSIIVEVVIFMKDSDVCDYTSKNKSSAMVAKGLPVTVPRWSFASTEDRLSQARLN